ncbi:MAG: hypothetical protein EXR57_02880 [Dehalococcoidia bacterium]|nr:hypothetical protein [Dehalococcoidia bacterium]MSQ34745.1 hypothetical protein [Dehalococcoidia bacterium]
MPRRKSGSPGVQAAVAPETAEESSRIAALAGLKLSIEDAAWVANKTAQRRAASETVRSLNYRGHEPANTFGPARYG